MTGEDAPGYCQWVVRLVPLVLNRIPQVGEAGGKIPFPHGHHLPRREVARRERRWRTWLDELAETTAEECDSA